MRAIEELQIKLMLNELEELETLSSQLSATQEQMTRRIGELRKKLDGICANAEAEREVYTNQSESTPDIENEDEGEENEGIDIVAETLNSSMSDDQRELLIAAGLIEPEDVPEDAPTEQLIATPEEAEAARKAMGSATASKEESKKELKPKRASKKTSAIDKDEDESENKDEDLVFLNG